MTPTTTIRTLDPAEVERAVDWAAREGWNPGLADAAAFLAQDNGAFRGLFRNQWLWLAVALGLVFQVAVIHVSTLQRAFGTVSLDPGDWLLCAAVASTIVLAREAGKAWWRAVDRHRSGIT